MQADVQDAPSAGRASRKGNLFEPTPLTPYFAGRLDGVDLRKPFTPEQVTAFRAAMDRFAVLVIPGQALNDAEQVRFAEQFGKIEDTPTLVDQGRRRLANMKINDISNIGASGEVFDKDLSLIHI